MTAIMIIVSLPGGNLENISNSAMIYQLPSFSSPSPTIPSKNLFVLLNKRPGNFWCGMDGEILGRLKITQSAFTCSKSTIDSPEHCLKSAQS